MSLLLLICDLRDPLPIHMPAALQTYEVDITPEIALPLKERLVAFRAHHLGIIGFLGNEGVALFRIKVGKEIGSAALIADGYHARVDGWTSLAVLFAAVGVWLGYPLADPIVGAGITVAICSSFGNQVRPCSFGCSTVLNLKYSMKLSTQYITSMESPMLAKYVRDG